MRGYLEASSFPLIEIGGVPIPRVIMGHLPFVGESYQGIEKNWEYAEKFSYVENIIEVLKKAVNSYGVTAMAVMPTTLKEQSEPLLNAILKTIKITDIDLGIIPCIQIPLTIDGVRVDAYRRWVTYYSIEKKIGEVEIYEKIIKDPILLCREGWGKKFPEALCQLRPYSDKEIEQIKIDYEGLDETLSCFDGFKILLAEPGSESDLLAMTGRTDLLIEFADWLRDKLKCPIVIGTHHAGLTIPILEKSEIAIAGYVTPVNKRGVMMFPTQRLAFEAIRQSAKKIIATKPLAGGRISPDEAFRYIYGTVGADACMVGVASLKEVDEDFSSVKRTLKINKTPE